MIQRRICRNLSTALLLLAGFAGSGAQPLPGGPRDGEDPQFIFVEAVNLVADDPTQSRVDVLYRIDHDFFVAVRNSDATIPFPFRRRGEVLIELVDSLGESRARHIDRLELGAASTERSQENKKWYRAATSFSVAPGRYSVVVEVDDNESDRKFLDKRKTIRARRFGSSPFEVADPLFVDVTDNTVPSEITPDIYGGNLLFGKSSNVYLQVRSPLPADQNVSVRYGVFAVLPANDDTVAILPDTVIQCSPHSGALATRTDKQSTTAGEEVQYTILPGPAGLYHLLVPVPTERLPLRSYQLRMTITQGNFTAELRHPFTSVWPEMPMSLRDPDFALEVLKYITTEDQFDSLRSGPRRRRVTSLEDFWKAKDQTPNTAYNEVMVQYYRRVDVAMRTLSSLKGGDGYKSARGRIYILYGPPTKSERTLDPVSGFVETWSYENLKKQFIFVDQSRSGNYVLLAEHSL